MSNCQKESQMTVVILGDYQNVALELADWSALSDFHAEPH